MIKHESTTLPEIPDATKKLAKAVFRRPTRYMVFRDQLGHCFTNEQFSEFRSRLVDGERSHVLFDAMLECFNEAGLLKGRGRQRTDSTHILSAARVLGRLGVVCESIRLALNAIANTDPEWLRGYAPAKHSEWRQRYGLRFDESHTPKSESARQTLCESIGAHGVDLLTAYASRQQTTRIPAVEILRQVWIQQNSVTQNDSEELRVIWRAIEDMPPVITMIKSPHDVDARYAVKGETRWIGYKAHFTETCADDSPHVVTNITTTAALAVSGKQGVCRQ